MATKYTKVYQETVELDPTKRDIFQIHQPVYKVYKKRWIILAIYVLYAILNSFQSFEYSIITSIVMKYYGISSVRVDWLSIIYMALYMPLVIPASYIMDRKGLRVTALIGSIGTALGTFIKIFSINQDQFWLVYIGQIILSSVTVFIQPLPPRIAAVWFGPDQMSLACGLGMFGTILGQTLGTFLPPLMVGNHDDLEAIGWELGYLSYALAALTVILALIVIIYFPAEPPSPPSVNQALDRLNRTNRSRRYFFMSVKRLLMDPAFMLHSCAYGITVGVGAAVVTLFNQIFVAYFPSQEEELGSIMICCSVFGTISILFLGYFLDKSRKYIETTVILATFLTIAYLGAIYGLESRTLTLIYIIVSLLGFSFNGYMLVGYELAVELTYPEPESTSTGILISISQTSGAILTFLLGYMLEMMEIVWVLLFVSGLCFVCVVITAALPKRLRRQKYSDINQNQIKA